MASTKPAVPKPSAKKAAAAPAETSAVKAVQSKDPVRVAAGKKGAPVAQATRTVAQAAPLKPSIARDAPASVVDKLIASIKGRGAKLDHDIHSAAMACLFHADKHGDITLMNRLLLAMPKSTRRNALAQWAVKFGKFKPSEDTAAQATAPLAFDKSNSTDFDGAQAMPFWDFKNVKEGTTEWLFSNYIEGVMRTLGQKAAGSGPEAMKAKAAFDAIKGVNEALNTASTANMTPPPPGVPERRSANLAVTAVQQAKAAASAPPVH